MAEQTADARIYDYVNTQTTKDLTAFHDVDKPGYDAAKKESGNVARQLATLEIDGSGDATPDADFENYELIKLTIDRTSVINLLNIPANTKVHLHVIKGAAHVATFYYLTPVHESYQTGKTLLIYEIVKGATDSDIYINRIDDQESTAIAEGVVTANEGTFASFDHLKVFVDGKMAHIHGLFVLDVSGLAAPQNTATFDFTLPYTPLYAYSSINIYSGLFPCTAVVSATGISIVFAANIANGNTISFYINGIIPIV